MVARALAPTLAVLALLTPAACRPDLEASPSLVTGPRILAVVAEPPEARPGAAVTLHILAADAGGTLVDPLVGWGFCIAPKPLTENNTVHAECRGDAAIVPIEGATATVTATLPKEACALFGPDAPPGGFRPRDPDVTGGFYQPVRALIGGELTFALPRITCNLANAPVDVARAFQREYVANRNPHLLPLTASIDGRPLSLDALPIGRAITLHTGWPAEDAEPYVAFDAATRALVDRREAMRVTWLATGGAFTAEKTGVAEGDASTTTRNTWTPPAPGTHRLWVVLRDSRGGVAYAEHTMTTL